MSTLAFTVSFRCRHIIVWPSKSKMDEGFGYARSFGTAHLISAALGGVGCSDNRVQKGAGKKYKCGGCPDAMSYGSCDLCLSFVNMGFRTIIGWLGAVDPILSYRTAQNFY